MTDARDLTDLDYLDELITALDAVRTTSRTSAQRRAELSLPWPHFARLMRLQTAQSWGSRMQNYLVRFYGWTGVAQSLDAGDARTEDDEVVEVKVSMITPSNPTASFVQIRPHQDIDGYRLFVVEEDYTVRRFDLTKDEMSAELALLGTGAHGTGEAAASQDRREWAIRIPWTDNDTRRRWEASYTSSALVPQPSLAVYATAREIADALAELAADTLPAAA